MTISLEKLASHGSPSGPNHDGWGIAYFDGRDVRLVKEAGPALGSAGVRFVEEKHLASSIVIAHIRQATKGPVTHANAHPFTRELGGRMHAFAHNGSVPGVFDDPRFELGRFRPIGETDSEYAFCALLARLTDLWTAKDEPTRDARADVIRKFASELRALGAANFLYADSQALFVHSHERRWTPDGGLQSPGLHMLRRTCPVAPPVLVSPGVRVETLQPATQIVTLVASVPLTDEPWSPLAEGELSVLEVE